MNQLKLRGIKIVVTLSDNRGTFEDNANQKIIRTCSLRDYIHAQVNIHRQIDFQSNNAQITLFGLNVDDIEILTKYNLNYASIQVTDSVQIYAGYLDSIQADTDGNIDTQLIDDAIDKLPLVWNGQIISAYPNYNNPERPFIINSIVYVNQLITLRKSNNNTQTLFSTAVQRVITEANAGQTNIKFNLLYISQDTTITDYTDDGGLSAIEYLTELASNYGYQIVQNYNKSNVNLIDISFYSVFYPDTTGRAPQILSKDNGMIGYPQIQDFGLQVVEFFNPARRLFDSIQLQTYVKPLNNKILNVWQQQISISTHDEAWDSTLTLYDYLQAIQ